MTGRRAAARGPNERGSDMPVQIAQLKAVPRSEKGSRASHRLRQAGFVPAVIYGHKQAVIPVKVSRRELAGHLAGGAHVFDLDVDGASEKVLVKEVQYDHLGADILHVDFTRVSLDEKVRLTVPLELRGEPKGAAEGGVLTQVIARLEIECRVLEIPDVIRHNIAEMKIDDVLHIKDIALPPGVRCLQDGELIVATLREAQELVAPAAAEEAGPAEPEVIGRKAAEEGEAEASEGGEKAGGRAQTEKTEKK